MLLQKPTDEAGKCYVSFMRVCLDQIRQRVNDELYTLTIFESWYSAQMKMIGDWLTDRLEQALHPYQLTCLINMTKVKYNS